MEADFLAKMRSDGVLLLRLSHQFGITNTMWLPEKRLSAGVWPNTVSTAAAGCGACAMRSSPHFEKSYPQAATNYLARQNSAGTSLTNAHFRSRVPPARISTSSILAMPFYRHDELGVAACRIISRDVIRSISKNFFIFPGHRRTVHTLWGCADWRWYEMRFGEYATAATTDGCRINSTRVTSPMHYDHHELAATILSLGRIKAPTGAVSWRTQTRAQCRCISRPGRRSILVVAHSL